MAIFPVSLGENRISQGVEDWGSLISVPSALRGINYVTIFCQMVFLYVYVLFSLLKNTTSGDP